jgi:hypothetical protein
LNQLHELAISDFAFSNVPPYALQQHRKNIRALSEISIKNFLHTVQDDRPSSVTNTQISAVFWGQSYIF